jgi:hypothetical protein
MERSMADLRIGSGPFFEHGIERIVDAQSQSAQGLAAPLPDLQPLAPSALAHTAALAELLGADNLESMLEAAVCPLPDEREWLAPQRFQDALQEAADHFGRAAQAAQFTQPALHKLLGRAAQVLAGDRALREQLQMYRRALLQG